MTDNPEPTSLLQGLLVRVRAGGADAADAVLFHSADVQVSTRRLKPQGIERSESAALGLRAWVGKKQAIVSSTDISSPALEELAERVVGMARAATEDADSTLAPEPLLAHAFPALDLYDDDEPTAEWLMQQCKECEEAALSVPGITNSEGADATYGRSTITLATAKGFAQTYRASHASVSVAVLAGSGTGMERDYDYASVRHRSDLPPSASIGAKAAERTLKRLNPRKVATVSVPVVFDPRVSGSLLSAFAGAINGSSIARGTSFLKDAMHQPVFSNAVSIVDDPHRVRGLGSKPFDGEGVGGRKITLVKDGVLQSWLLDVRTANRLKLQTTGHASRGVASPPSPSSTNLYMEAGKETPEVLLAGIKNGFYVTEAYGMGVNLVTGDYSQGAGGFWIENGKIAYPVSEVTIAGHLKDMFAHLTPANDLEFRYATNAPTLFIERMMVAGRERMLLSGESFSGKVLFRRLVREHVARYRGRLALAIGCMIVGAAMNAANAYMMKPVLDKVFIAKDTHALVVVPVIVLAIALVSALASYGQSFLMRYVGQRIICDMQIRLFSHLMRCDLGVFHDQASGRLISRFSNDIQMLRYLVATALTTLARELFSMVFLLGVMVYQSWVLALIALAVFPLAVWPMMRLSKRMRKIADGTMAELGEFTSRLDEVFQGVRTVKAYNRESYEEGRARSIIERLFSMYFKAARVQAAASPMMEVLSGFAIAAVIAYGGMQVMEGATTTGTFASFLTAFIMAYRPVKALAGVNTTIQEGLAAANRFFNAIDTAPTVQDKPGAAALQVKSGQIEFRDVSFHYAPGAGGVEHIVLAVQPGQKVALVGHSGGGKSTLFNLLLRFYDVESGAICIDGVDIRDITQASLRDSIAFVPQDTVLFEDTVQNNIAYGRLDASVEEIKAAARAAHADEFITRLPEGYSTLIGPHGVKLSGGQRQRLAIARAMLKNAPILLLDEATSALDNTSERAVQEALSRLMQGRTTFVIAHRLSTVMGADLIHVIEHGRVVESGTHEALLVKGGAYHRLYAEALARPA